ncbi:MAG: N-acetylmuramoyl-L-alanine amidase [Planctomycetes bacterium]|nr:N-acetylmuramoyl-L-alanine amidase [Planctomycetota bacterium]
MRRDLALACALGLALLLTSCSPAGPIEVKDPPFIRQPDPAAMSPHDGAVALPALPLPTPSRPTAFPSLIPIRKQLVVSTPFPWRYIVLHHSATPNGNAAEFDAMHRRKGWDGLGYHFVVGNGHDSGDGELEVGYRWRGQLQGAHAGNFIYNRYGIGVCLVGNFETSTPTSKQLHSTAELVAYLMIKFRIPAQNVTIHRAFRDTACPGRRFPLSQLVREAGLIVSRTR